MHLYFTKIVVFLSILIFSGCLLSPQQLNEDVTNDAFQSKQTIQDNYPIPKLSGKFSPLQNTAVLTQVQLCNDMYKQSVKAYKLSKEYLDLCEKICEQAVNEEEINEIEKQKQFQIMKQQEEKRRLQRIEKRNQERRLEISKVLQTQRKIDAQIKHKDTMKKIDEIDSLDDIREILEEIKIKIAYFNKKTQE